MERSDNGRYKEIFGTECHPTLRCAVGSWQGGAGFSAGISWDAYIFASPLPSTFKFWDVDVVMNIYGAEQVAAYQFEANGIKLYNPCEHINAFHWHCQGGKMHSENHDVRVDKWPHRAVKDIFPCWDCPGITMPMEYAGRETLCRKGAEQWSSAVREYFKTPQMSVSVCCADAATCDALPLKWLGTCIDAEDVDCVIWENVGGVTVY